jgi:hypothetical protein
MYINIYMYIYIYIYNVYIYMYIYAYIFIGILDAGGRNVVVSMQSRNGFMKMGGAVGILLFVQFWYWYPLEHFLSLAFSPTMLIGSY